jgi:phospholipid/cholesterol/gamma-HCH transport system substrate-binding protein
METRANYILVGLFTLVVIAGAFGFVYWFHHIGGTGERAEFRVAFQGPVAGLRTGATVSFNGIRVGEVTAMQLDPKDPRQSLVTISVEKSTPVRADTSVSLDYQGLTGIAVLALRGGASSAGPVSAKDANVPLLQASASASQDLMQSARDVIRRLDAVLAENEAALKASIKNVEVFTTALAGNTEKINNTLSNVDTFTGALARNSEKFDRIMSGIENLVGGGDGKGELPVAARAIKNAVENLDKKVDGLVSDGRRTFGVIEKTVRNFDENPTRLIFGGGRPANAAGAGIGPIRQNAAAPGPTRQNAASARRRGQAQQ